MGHKILEAIIKDGQIQYSDKKLPPGKLKVHIIYDIEIEKTQAENIMDILKETSGLYKKTDVAIESEKLRKSWERDAKDKLSC